MKKEKADRGPPTSKRGIERCCLTTIKIREGRISNPSFGHLMVILSMSIIPSELLTCQIENGQIISSLLDESENKELKR